MPLASNDRITLSISGLSLALGLSIYFLNDGHPAVLIACCVSIAVASIIYSFLGGVGSNSVSTSVFKLGGSAAVFAILAYFINDQLVIQNRAYKSNEENLALLDAASESLALERNTVESLRKQLKGCKGGSPQTALELLKAGTVSDADVREIKRMCEQSEKPFRNTLREMTVKISVVGDILGTKFRFCPKTMDQLYDGLRRQSEVQFFGENGNIRLRENGRIGANVCNNPKRDFEIQIGCASAEELFGEIAKDCRSSGALRGQEIVIGAIP